MEWSPLVVKYCCLAGSSANENATDVVTSWPNVPFAGHKFLYHHDHDLENFRNKVLFRCSHQLFEDFWNHC